MRLMWQVAIMGDRKYTYRVLVERYKGKRLLGKPRLRGEDNIKRDHQEL
jgi:hypothetical protein